MADTKLVPLEPTPAMCAAMVRAIPQLESIWTTVGDNRWQGTVHGDSTQAHGRRNCQALYRAILEAVPDAAGTTGGSDAK